MDIPPDISVSFTHPDIESDISHVVSEYIDQSCVKSRSHPRSGQTESDSCSDDENQDEYQYAAASNIYSPIVQSRIRAFLSSGSDIVEGSVSNPESVNLSDPESAQSHACKTGCLQKLNADRVLENRLNMQELEKGERDLIILGQLQACGLSKGDTMSKGDRKRHRFSYQFDNETVCAECFMYINNITSKYLKNIRKQFYTHGVVPRRHGNKGKMPHNALKYEDVQNIVQFLIGYADRYGMPQPYSRGVTDIIPPIYLPAQKTYDSVHKKYLNIAEEMDFRSVGETTFRSLWKQCVPHIQFMRTRSDVCHICEKYRKDLLEANTEDEKLSLAQSFAEHIQRAQTERDYYKQRCKDAEAEYKSGINREDMKCIHYTFDFAFDFAQPVLVPGHVRQEGALYYKTPLKVNWFGILNDGKPHMYNYIFSEGDSMGLDNANSHSSSAVVSMIDDFFLHHSEGEQKCFINCDNCGGQNKNQTVIGYFSWRTILGYHKEINLHFLQPYHARCQIDGMFGIGRQKLRKNDVDSVMQVADVILRSCKYCSAKVYTESGNSWVWRDWKHFLGSYFKPIPNVRKYFHFKSLASDPGYVVVKESVDSQEKRICILKHGKSVTRDVPSRVESAGLSATRQWYLYRNVRKFIPPSLQDITAPLTSVPETSVLVEE